LFANNFQIFLSNAAKQTQHPNEFLSFSIFSHLCFGELCGVRREIFVVPGVFASFAYKMEVCTGSCRLVLPRQCNVPPAPAREKKSNGIQYQHQHQQKKKHKVCSLEVGESSAFMGEKVTHGFLKVAGQRAPLLRRDKTPTKFRTAKKQPKLAISSVLADFPFETLQQVAPRKPKVKELANLSKVVSIILGGGAGTRLNPLTLQRATPAVKSSNFSPLGSSLQKLSFVIF
jgi:hypothetical protein